MTMLLYLGSAAGALLLLLLKWVFRSRAPNPFAEDCRKPPQPLVTEKSLRQKVLKQGFAAEKVPEKLDAIVIGSGIGGLGAAAVLAKAGKRVLVLEQHSKAGGCCHTFGDKGYEFDVGIHYIGQLHEKSPLRLIVDQLTEGQLQWAKMDNPFDVVILGDPSSSKQYPLYSGEKAYVEGLKKQFPGETQAIDKFMQLVKSISKSISHMVIMKMIPLFLAKFLIRTGLVNLLSPFFKLASKSVTQVVNELTENEELRAVFAYIFGTYGVFPKEASFTLHSILINHYLEGGWYPRGGASEIAFHLIPVIERSGGAVLTKATVQSILLNHEHQACGVSVQTKGQPLVNITAPVVISDAGIFNTYEKLLPPEVQTLPGIRSQLSMVGHGVAGISLFLGIKGTKEELGLPATNYFIFPDKHLNELEHRYCNANREDAAAYVPMVYVASPSAKDPTWEERFPGRSTLAALTFAPYEWFEDWKDKNVKKRGADYDSLKDLFAHSMIETVQKLFPSIQDKIDCISTGTPLSNQHYIAAPRGEWYGANHGMDRMTAEVTATLRSTTPIKNLYLTGFEASKVPENLDAVVIGSGIGGLAVAAMLAKAGKRVLVVEQLAKTGGCCHTFNEQGYEFDVGIHYIGEMSEGDHLRLIIDQLSEGQLQWAKMESPFDVVVLGGTGKQYPLHSGEKAYVDGLKKMFPTEAQAIDKYMHLVKDISRCTPHLAILKLIPLPLAQFFCHTGIVTWLSSFFKMASKSVSQVIEELTDHEELRAVLAYVYFNYGVFPRNASFSMHALLVYHFLEGGWYPQGGGSEIAFHLIPVIEKSGGVVMARAPVKRILVDEAGRACGVNVQRKGRDPVNIFAPVVISNAGIFNTYEKLLPTELQALPGIRSQLSCVRHGLAGFSLFVGLDGTKESLGLPATNFFIFPDKNLNDVEDLYFSSSREDAPRHIPVLFASFPSAKDPAHEQRCPGKSTLTVLTFVRYDWFEEWKDLKVQKRGAEYEDLKKTFADAILETVLHHFPNIQDKVVCVSSGTPLTNQHYIAASLGEFYGAEHSMERMSAKVTASLRAQTPIKNLYLTGQDAFVCGFAGALQGAMVCASNVLNRNLYHDVARLQKRIKVETWKKTDR